MTYDGVPVVTYFFSTSGGRTEDVENTPLGNEPRPWLKSVDDPYDDTSPRHRWGPIRMTLGQADRKLGSLVKGKFRGIEVVRRGRSPRIVEADVIGTARAHARDRRAAAGALRAVRHVGVLHLDHDRRGAAAGGARGPPTGGTEPFGSAAWLRAHSIGALARPRAAGAQERRACRCSGATAPSWVDGRHGARAPRRPLRLRRDRRRASTGVRYHDENGPAVRVS